MVHWDNPEHQVIETLNATIRAQAERIKVLEKTLREVPTPLTENRSPFAESMRSWREKHLVTIAEALRADKEEGNA